MGSDRCDPKRPIVICDRCCCILILFSTKMYFLPILVLLCTLVNGEWNTKDYLRREHSLVKPYQGAGLSMPFWDFSGSTVITSSYIRLTSDLQSKSGAIWNTVPCRSRNWELQVQFKVSGKGKDLFGDGFAIWYAKERMVQGPVFGSKDFFHGLEVILDTYSNHNGPHNVCYDMLSLFGCSNVFANSFFKITFTYSTHILTFLE